MNKIQDKTLYWLSSLGIVGLSVAGYFQYHQVYFDSWWHAIWLVPSSFIFVGVPGIAIGELSIRKVQEYW